MSPDHHQWTLVVVLASTLAGSALGQEAQPAYQEDPAAAEKPADSNPYAALRESKNRGTRALAERYADLISTQDWTDKSGQFKTRAKYVEHDPDLKWVKLATAMGRGENRVVKESKIALVNLNKSSQSRVRQIAALQKKLDELAAAEKTEAGGSSIVAGDERGEYVAAERGRRGTGAPESDAAGSEVDPTQWATSYAAFRANFALAPNESGEKVLDWGELRQLQELSESAPARTGRGEGEAAAPPPLSADVAARLGEVHWEAPFLRAQILESGDREVRFRLPALPRPLKIRFLIDRQDSFRNWSELPANKPVQFIGRFERVQPREIMMRVRLTNPPSDSAGSETVREQR